MEAEGLVEPGPAESPEPAAKPARTGGRRRAGAGGAESGGRWSPGAAGDADSESADGEESGGRRRKSGRRSGAAADGEPGGRRRRGAAVEEDVDPEVRARDICLRLLTGTAKTRKQLADALRRKEIPAEVIERVLDRYEEVGLIDDAAFAQAWVEQRHAGRRLGRRALAQELRTRGVEGELVEQAVAQVEPEDEEAAARDLVERKLRTTRGLDSQVRTRRLVGMLARRGYAEGLAFRVVRAALQAEGEDGEDDPLEW
nr:recombination regulator RecX [Kitasatospora sp. MMS16-BH015]